MNELLMIVEIPTALLVVIAILIAMILGGSVFALLILNKFRIATLEAHYDSALEDLNLQLENKLISDDSYRWLRSDIERKYKSGFDKD